MASTSFIDETDGSFSFGEWIKRRRRGLNLTQAELAERANCTVFALRKIEAEKRRPSKQLAGLLAQALELSPDHQAIFVKIARGELPVERLNAPVSVRLTVHPFASIASPALVNFPILPTSFIGREAELAVLGRLLAEPDCRLLTITGLGGIGKTRLAVELASSQQASFPGSIYYVSLASLNSPEFFVPAIAKVFKLSFSGTDDRKEQLFNHLAASLGQARLLVLDNLEHLLVHPSKQDGEDEIFDLLAQLLERVPSLKILTTSRERINIREEWVFELHGLPIPDSEETTQFEDYSSVTLFLQRARQQKAEFEVLPEDRPALIRICQLVEGTPLAIELAAAWVRMFSLQEIAQEIASNRDFLTARIRNIPERHRSFRAVFAHSWKLLSDQERDVLCRLSVFRGGFLRQAAAQVAGATLPVLVSLLSKSLILRRENERYDLHALIRQCALEELQDSGYFLATCNQHLAYFVSLALDAYHGLRSAQLAEWLSRIDQEHSNIRAALEWAFMLAAPPERVEEGLRLVISIDRYWSARGHIREGINWVERGLQASEAISLTRAKALRVAGWLVNHGNDDQAAIALLQESVAISRQLNDELCQANALDTLGDVAWRNGDFAKARDYYAESLELYRRGGDPSRIGLSLASAGRLHVDYGSYQEAERLLTEALPLLKSASDLRGTGYCLNALGRLALMQGEVKQAATWFRQALSLNHELGYVVDISECLHELAVVEAIAGDEHSATLLWAAATAIQKRIGFTFPIDDPIHTQAPVAWLQAAPASKEWAQGESMSPDQAVDYALGREIANGA
jgi:predicted ATPase/DNA-binding XRE family transcriptional regulator/Tfp pilus assembly protein PilF